jgi:hypothetical protein
MKQKCAHAFIESAERALGFAVLLTSVRAREPKVSAMFREKTTKWSIVEFSAIISLQG